MKEIYELDGKVNPLKAIPYGLQHVLAMFVANITPIIIVAGACGISTDNTARMIQSAMMIAGIGTFIQLFPLWKIGSRLPIVMGISFTFVGAACGIGAAFGYGTVIGAVICGGIFEGLIGLFGQKFLKFITPVVAANVVIAIGVSLLSVGARSFGGGYTESFGSAESWIIASVTLVSGLLFQRFAKNNLKSLSVLFALVVGYILAICMGKVDFSAVKNSSIIGLPSIFMFKPVFNAGAIISFCVIFLVSATETIGDTSALCASGLKREVTEKEAAGSIACDGFVSSLSGIFGCTPITSFSQNIGLVAMTGVVNRIAIATGAGILVLAGIFPVFGAVLATLPDSVLGGCTVMMFGSILFSGMEMLSKAGFSRKNMTITALALSVGVGFTFEKEIFKCFPQIFQTIFADNCVAVVFVIALIFSLIMKDDAKTSPASENSETVEEK